MIRSLWIRMGMVCVVGSGVCGAGEAGMEATLSAEGVKAFMKDMARYVEERHLRSDDAPQRGMIYEFYVTSRAGEVDQWIQGEALDTMHDGAWYAAAMAHAWRATGDRYYLDFLNRYQIPFYTNALNNSDTLFKDGLDPKKAADSRNDFGLSHKYLGEKGFCPYWWDDGSSVSLETHWRQTAHHPYGCVDYLMLAGEPNPRFRLKGFSLGCSNHMAQDLAVMLMQTWLVTRDKRIAEAAMHLHRSRVRRKCQIPMNIAAAGLTNGDAELLARTRTFPEWGPRNAYVAALYDYQPDQTQWAPNFTDDQEFNYTMTIAREGGRLPENVAMILVYDAYTLPMMVRYWSDTGPMPAGMNRSESSPVIYQGGRPTKYRSDWDLPWGSRMGPQNMVVCAWALQALRNYPGLWAKRYRERFADDLLVRIVDRGPEVDGTADDAYSEPVEMGDVTLRLVSEPQALYVAGLMAGERTEITVFAKPGCDGRSAVVRLARSGEVTVTNGDDAALVHQAKVLERDADFDFEIRIPYTVVKEQTEWLTGIEHGRYSIRVGEEFRNLYLLSTEDRVRRALWRELAEGLANWEKVFRDKGFLPAAFDRKIGDYPLAETSESGGYAHLITAAAQYLYLLEGKYDWQQENIPTIRQ